ncbi:hypothetical protein E1952_14835 [Staphylococcus aureus]|nr:hypothetical protein E1952_14835 [Staphylococcus aureus]
MICYSTHVERVEKFGDEWKVTLRREEDEKDYWWVEWFDAVIVASGHFNVPYVPAVQGLEDLEKQHPGSVLHSKMYRGRDAYKGKRVVVVGGSVSAADISTDLVGVVDSKVYAVVNGHTINVYFGDGAFNNPGVIRKPTISHIDTSAGRRTVHFVDGTSSWTCAMAAGPAWPDWPLRCCMAPMPCCATAPRAAPCWSRWRWARRSGSAAAACWRHRRSRSHSWRPCRCNSSMARPPPWPPPTASRWW